jgi:hypothetical protein
LRRIIFADTWHDHILDPQVGHGEMAPHIDAVLGHLRRRIIASQTSVPIVSASTSAMQAPVAG